MYNILYILYILYILVYIRHKLGTYTDSHYRQKYKQINNLSKFIHKQTNSISVYISHRLSQGQQYSSDSFGHTSNTTIVKTIFTLKKTDFENATV